MFESSIPASSLKSIGGSLCLGFANTLVYRKDETKREDRFKDFGGIVTWASRIGLLNEAESTKFKQRAKKWPVEASIVWQRALLLRDTIIRIFSAVDAGRNPAPGDISAMNALLSETLARLRITPSTKGMMWSWSGWLESPDSLLWPIIYSAGNLLTTPALFHVKECEGRGCGWFFVDTSRNQLRRWCNMSDCGNREKVRRFHARKQESKHSHHSKRHSL